MKQGGITAMKFKTILRHFREGIKNIGRSGWMSFASISAVTVMLFIVGFFLIVFVNGNHIASTIENNVEIRAFIERGTGEEEVQELLDEVNALPEVEEVIFIDKEEGLESLIASTGEVYENIREENPLPDALRVTATSPQDTEAVAQKVSHHNYVSNVSYGADVLPDLFKLTNTSRVVGLVVILGLLLTAMFLISNTIKLTIVARKKEIQIMKLVGATNSFVRSPFLVEGALLGTFGSIGPILILSFGYQYVYSNSGDFLQSSLYSLLEPGQLIVQVSLLLLAVGLIVGIWGSAMSVRKFLNV